MESHTVLMSLVIGCLYSISPGASIDIGEYTVVMEGVYDCEEPTLVNGHLQLSNKDNKQEIRGYFTVPEDYHALQGHLHVKTKRNGVWKNDVGTVEIADLCEVKLVKDVMKSANLTLGAGCTLNKGDYKISNLQLNGPIHGLLGQTTLYAIYRSEMTFLSLGRRVSCVVIDTQYVPKKRKNYGLGML